MARRQHRRRNFSTAQWAVFAVGGVAGIGLLGWGVYRYVTKEDEAIPPAAPQSAWSFKTCCWSANTSGLSHSAPAPLTPRNTIFLPEAIQGWSLWPK